jgi:hypothetical protein
VGSVQVGGRKGRGTYCVREAPLTVTSSREVGLASTTTQHDSQYNTLRLPRLVPLIARLSMVIILLEGLCFNKELYSMLHEN